MIPHIDSFEAYQAAYARSIADPAAFWSDIADSFVWREKWHTPLIWEFRTPDIQWFVGGKLNITENCLDRHLATRATQTALIWEANEPNTPNRVLTYADMYAEVCRAANALRAAGIGKGDRVCIYMPMVPELMISLLACARVGAIHSVVFAGFSAAALADRIKDAGAKLVITCNESYRGAKTFGIKTIVDEALAQDCTTVENVWVYMRTANPPDMQAGRDSFWADIMAQQPATAEAETMDSEDPLFILYTSGSTGKPKGVVHTCGGYMVYAEYSFRNVFQYKQGDIYFCTADIGWVTGHTYMTYAPLLAAATQVMFEGVPNYPDAGRFWDICDKHKITHFYTAPTAIRSLMAAGDTFVERADLGSLKVLGSVGEPINAEAWHWYSEKVGKKRCPIVDTWWQTETGGILLSPIAHYTPLKPCFATLPLPGVQPCLLDKDGKELIGNNVEGLLCIKFPFPSMLRTTYGDHERCRLTYFSAFPNYYFTGDGARRDEDGYYRIIGRVDDVINVSGHRFGTAEIENAINEHENVVESAVVGFPHGIKGEGIYAFVIPHHSISDHVQFRLDVLQIVSRLIGAIARPDKIQIVSALPKTRSGKIMRRILRKIAHDEIDGLGDTSTLLNPEIVEELIQNRL
jgi:acetyl-CoA synthetase